MQERNSDANGSYASYRFGRSADAWQNASQPSSAQSSPSSSRRSSPRAGKSSRVKNTPYSNSSNSNSNNNTSLQAASIPLPLSRRNSWTNVGADPNGNGAPQQVNETDSTDGRVPSAGSPHSSVLTLTPAPARNSSLSALASLASPATYYRPAARFFTNSRPNSSSGRPKSSQSSGPTSNPGGFDQEAHQLILNALERTKNEVTLQRTDSIASTRSNNSQKTHLSSAPPGQVTPDKDKYSPTASPQLTPSASSSVLGKGWGSMLGFSSGKDKDKEDKESQRGRSSIIDRPDSSPAAPTTGMSSARSSWLGSATNVPLGRTLSRSSLSNPGSPVPAIGPPQPLTGGKSFPMAAAPAPTPASADKGRRGRSEDRTRARSSSPFRLYRSRTKERDAKEKEKDNNRGRSQSPAISALRQSDAESDAETLGKRGDSQERRRRRKGTKVRSTAFDMRVREDDEDDDDEEEDEDDSWSDDEDDSDEDDGFDPTTQQNTEANSTPLDFTSDLDGVIPLEEEEIELPDPLGEGVNVIRPEEPMFVRTLMGDHRPRKRTPVTALAPLPEGIATADGDGTTKPAEQGAGPSTSPPAAHPMVIPGGPTRSASTHTSGKPKRKKTIKGHGDPLPLDTSRPKFEKNKCTVVLRHGDPLAAEDVPEGQWQRAAKRYLVANDLSEESKWAVEWGIGTVLRDGDEMVIVTVQESEAKLDPVDPKSTDRLNKLRNQQERQALSYLLVRQATALLQRTKLNVTVVCIALHAKNSRRMLLDLIDLYEPTMVIVGSRGLGKIKGILLGSTSHYLIQKASVPVMVARRRLKRPARKVAATASEAHQLHAARRVSLAEAAIDKQSTGKGKGSVGVDPEEMQKEDEQAEQAPKFDMPDDDDSDTEAEVVASPTSPRSPRSPARRSITSV